MSKHQLVTDFFDQYNRMKQVLFHINLSRKLVISCRIDMNTGCFVLRYRLKIKSIMHWYSRIIHTSLQWHGLLAPGGQFCMCVCGGGGVFCKCSGPKNPEKFLYQNLCTLETTAITPTLITFESLKWLQSSMAYLFLTVSSGTAVDMGNETTLVVLCFHLSPGLH